MAVEAVKTKDLIKEAANPNAPQELIELIAKANEINRIEDIQELSERKSNLDFYSIVMPPLESLQDFIWRTANWGTRWNACYVKGPVIKKRSVFYNFDVALSPPMPIIIALSKKFKGIKFTLKYYESAMRFKGILIMKNGDILKQEHGEYNGYR
jgi:hypothetical protein